MTLNEPFDLLIRSAGPTDKPASRAEVIVIIDARKRRVVSELEASINPPLEAEYYRVTNRRDRLKAAAGTFLALGVRDTASGRMLSMSLRYTARCEPGDEGRVALALAGAMRPSAIFRMLVEAWLSAYVGERPGALINDFFNQKADLEAYLSRRAFNEAGLLLTVELSPGDISELPPVVTVSLDEFPVRAKDCDAEKRLWLKAELALDDQKLINAYLARLGEAELRQLLADQVRGLFAKSLTLDNYYAGLRNRALAEMLMSYLNSNLRATGRRVQTLSVKGESPPPVYHGHIDVPYTMTGRAEEIVINNDVQMICRDPAAYENSGSPELEDWLTRNLGEIVRLTLFGKKYIDLLLGFESLKERMKDELSARAAEMGQEVDQFISTPDLEPYRWLKGFTVEPEESFKVKESKYPVRLKFTVTAQIEKLEDVAEYLNEGKSVPEEAKREILEEVKRALQKIDVGRFYLRFGLTDAPNEKPVEKLLEDQIREILAAKFKAKVSAVSLEVLETHVTDTYERLRGTICEFRVSLSRPGELGEDVFAGDLQFESIERARFDRFLLLCHDVDGVNMTLKKKIDEIKKQVEKNLQSELEGVPVGRLSNREMKEAISAVAAKYVREKYGLSVDVLNVRSELNGMGMRGVTLFENMHKSELEAAAAANKVRVEALRKLMEQLYGMIAAGEPEELIRQQKERIADLESHRPTSAASPWSGHGQLPEPESAGDSNLLPAPSRVRDDEPLLETDTES